MDRTSGIGAGTDKPAVRFNVKREHDDVRSKQCSDQPLRGVLAELERYPELRR